MMRMLRSSRLILIMIVFLALPCGRLLAADSSKVNTVTRQVETGAKQIGRGVEETATGIGQTVVEGAKLTGEKIQEAGKAVKPQARTAWHKVKAGANAFASGVKDFFHKVAGN